MNMLHSKSSSKCITQQPLVHHIEVYLYNIEVKNTSLMTKQKWNKLHHKKSGLFITNYDYPNFFHDLRKIVWKLTNFNLYLRLMFRWFQKTSSYMIWLSYSEGIAISLLLHCPSLPSCLFEHFLTSSKIWILPLLYFQKIKPWYKPSKKYFTTF